MYLIWAFIYVAFAILFFGLVLTFFTKGKQLFNNKFGNAITLVLVLGVIGMLSAEERDFSNTQVLNKDIKGHNVKIVSTTIEDNIPFDIHLSVSFKKDATGELIPCYSRSDISGFTCGYTWEYRYAIVNKLDDEKYSYSVTGLMHWNLLGISFYTQEKYFEGTFTVAE